jgi:2-haloacid dehalogenase
VIADRWASFDCYGTLVDWTVGIRGQLSRLWPDADADALLRRFHRIEPVVQSGRAISYRQVLGQTLARVAQEAGHAVPAGEDDALATSLPSWPVFPEVPGALRELHDRGWKLAILSNTDPGFLDASIEAIGVPVELRVVASEIGSYKPAHGHWTSFFERSSAARERHVHVAASLFHDIAPAAELGLTTVWINRAGEQSDLPRDAELPDLRDLPDSLDGLVPK